MRAKDGAQAGRSGNVWGPVWRGHWQGHWHWHWALALAVLGGLGGLPPAAVQAQVQVQPQPQEQVQGGSWVQIEAQPDLNTAMDRVRAYAAVLPQIQGYHLRSGWYGIAMGPFSAAEANVQLQSLLAQNMIPPDSYVASAVSFGEQFWPVGESTAPAAPATPEASLAPAPAEPSITLTAPEPLPSALPDETVEEARASEAELDAEGRMALQSALQWFGYYQGRVDGNIGAGSRRSMAAWQGAQGLEPTGVLTRAQRQGLLDSYRAEEASYGFETLDERESGIEISLPMAMLSFDTYTPPFVRYGARNGSGLSAMLISQPGTTSSLAGLYQVLQSLDIMPATGERSLGETSFTIHGQDGRIESLAYAEVIGSAVKGYILSWDAAQSARMQRVLPMVQASFRSTGDTVMDPGLVPLQEAVKRGLMQGLQAKQAKFSRSGFFIDAKGSVLTTLEAVASCGKVTLERNMPARVSFQDAASGIAVVTPQAPLAPRAVAAFAAASPAVGSGVAVSGYSYEGRLSAPVLTRGTLEEAHGLNGEAGLARLALQALPGDAGGPVLDASGAVVGMLLPAPKGAAKELPPGVSFAAASAALTQLLTNPQGPALTLNAAAGGAKVSPNVLNASARGMTVLVSCWE